MQLRTVVVALLSALLCVSVIAAAEEAKHEKIKRKDVPKKVMAAFKKDFPKVRIVKIEKETYADGTIHYEFEYKDKKGKEHEVEYNADGDQLEEHDDDGGPVEDADKKDAKDEKKDG